MQKIRKSRKSEKKQEIVKGENQKKEEIKKIKNQKKQEIRKKQKIKKVGNQEKQVIRKGDFFKINLGKGLIKYPSSFYY